MGACESTSSKVVTKHTASIQNREINSRAKKIVALMRKRIPRDGDSNIINFLIEFDLTEMVKQNVSNVERLLAEVVTQFRMTKEMNIVTWRDTTFPDDMPPDKNLAMFEILIYKRGQSSK